MTAKVTVTPLGIQGDAVIHADDAVASTHFWAVPWLLLLIVGAVLLFVAGVLWQRRRRRKRKPPSEMAGDPAGLPAPPTPTGAGSSPAGWAKRLALLIAVSCSCLTLPGTATAADAVPYVDQAVTGSIALCDVNGHNVLSGKLSDTPFVWRAVGTTAAPSPYDQPGRTAFLAAYQPRRGVDPGNWSGYGLAAASRYTNPAHPMSQAAANSSPLTDFTERYTPEWDGLVQLRLMLGGSGRVPLSTAYDATDIKVTGDSWQVVRGGTGPCGKSAGSATNAAVLLKLPGSLGTPKPGAIASPPPLKQSPVPQTSHASAGTTTDQGGGSSPTDGATPSSGIAQADRTKADGGSITPIVVVGVLGLGLGALLTIWARRRRTAA